MTSAIPVRYRIDARDRLVWFNEGWARFASENGYAADILGTSLWAHICDRTTVHIYRAIVERVRRLQRSATVPFRCDSPGLKRSMRLMIDDAADGEIQFWAYLEEATPQSTLRLLEVAQTRGSELLLMCSWCKRVHLGFWIEVDEAARTSRLLEEPALPKISHGICDRCRDYFRVERPAR